jgi:hypothetical protein
MPEGSGELFGHTPAQRPNSGDREAALDDGRDDDHHHCQSDLNGQMGSPDAHTKPRVRYWHLADIDSNDEHV